MAGTMMLPPPTPIMPERKPVKTPVVRSTAAVTQVEGCAPAPPSQGRARRMTAMTSRKAPKERLSFHSGRTWAYRAPYRAVTVAVTARRPAPRRSTCPLVA